MFTAADSFSSGRKAGVNLSIKYESSESACCVTALSNMQSKNKWRADGHCSEHGGHVSESGGWQPSRGWRILKSPITHPPPPPEPRSANTNHMSTAKPTFFHYIRVCLLEGGGLYGNGVCCGIGAVGIWAQSYKFRLFRTTPALSTSHMVRPVHSDAVIAIARSVDLYIWCVFWRVMRFAVTSCIFQKSRMSSTRALIQMIFMRLWQELKPKRNIAQTLICSANRERDTERNLPGNFNVERARERTVSC